MYSDRGPYVPPRQTPRRSIAPARREANRRVARGRPLPGFSPGRSGPEASPPRAGEGEERGRRLRPPGSSAPAGSPRSSSQAAGDTHRAEGRAASPSPPLPVDVSARSEWCGAEPGAAAKAGASTCFTPLYQLARPRCIPLKAIHFTCGTRIHVLCLKNRAPRYFSRRRAFSEIKTLYTL